MAAGGAQEVPEIITNNDRRIKIVVRLKRITVIIIRRASLPRPATDFQIEPIIWPGNKTAKQM
jgi:hypothetical protein